MGATQAQCLWRLSLVGYCKKTTKKSTTCTCFLTDLSETWSYFTEKVFLLCCSASRNYDKAKSTLRALSWKLKDYLLTTKDVPQVFSQMTQLISCHFKATETLWAKKIIVQLLESLWPLFQPRGRHDTTTQIIKQWGVNRATLNTVNDSQSPRAGAARGHWT